MKRTLRVILGLFLVVIIFCSNLVKAVDERFFIEDSTVKIIPTNPCDKMTEDEVKTSDLFTGYVGYLGSGKTEIEKQLSDYHNMPVEVLNKRSIIDDVFAAMLTSKDQGGISAYIQEIGATIGVEGSYYDDCVDAATIELMKELCSDDAFLDEEMKKISKQFTFISKSADVGEITVANILKVTKKLSSEQVEKMVELAEDAKGTVIDNADDMLDLMKIVATAAIIEDFKIEIVDGLMSEVDSDSDLYAGLSRLRSDMKLNFFTYVSKTYVEKRLFSKIEKNIESFFSLKSIQEITGKKFFGSTVYSIIGSIVLDSVKYLIHDIIGVPNAEEVITTYIYISFLQQIDSAIIRKETKFISQITMAEDIANYEKLFCTYVKCLKVTLEHTKSVAKASDTEMIDTAINELKNISYEEYLEECKTYIEGIPYNQRVIRNVNKELKYEVKDNELVFLESDDEISPYSNVAYTFEGKLLYGLSIKSNGFSNIDLKYIIIPSVCVEKNGEFSIEEGTCVIDDIVEVNKTSTLTVMPNASLFVKGDLQVNPNTSINAWAEDDAYTEVYNYGKISIFNDLIIKSHDGFYGEYYSDFLNYGSVYVEKKCTLWGPTDLLNESNGLFITSDFAMYDTANAAYSRGATVTNDGQFRVKGNFLNKDSNGDIIQKNDTAKVEFDNDIPSDISFRGFEKGVVYVHGNISNVTAKGTSCFVFCGNEVQTLTNMSLSSGQILNKSGIVLGSDINISGDFYGNGNPVDIGTYCFYLKEGGWLSSDTDYKKIKLVNEYKVTKNMEITGEVTAAKTVTICEDVALTVHGDMESTHLGSWGSGDGWLIIHGKLDVDGNLETKGRVRMEEDMSELIVRGTANGLGYNDSLKNGVIRLHGTVTSLTTTGASEVVFAGDDIQELKSISICAGRNENTRGIKLESDINISGDFYGNGNPVDIGTYCFYLKEGGWLSSDTDYKKIKLVNEYKVTKDMEITGEVTAAKTVTICEDVALTVHGDMESTHLGSWGSGDGWLIIHGKLEVDGNLNANILDMQKDTAELVVYGNAKFGSHSLNKGIVKLYGDIERLNTGKSCEVYAYKNISNYKGVDNSILILCGEEKQTLDGVSNIAHLVINNKEGILFQNKVTIDEIEQENGDIDAPKGMVVSNLKKDSCLRGSIQSLTISAWNDYNLELNNEMEVDIRIPNCYDEVMEVINENDKNRYIYRFSLRKLSVPRVNKYNCSVDKGTQINFYEGREGSKIYYTVDGTVPTVDSKLYQGEDIIVDKYTVLKAISVMEGVESSDVVSYWYSIKKYNVTIAENVNEFVTVDSASCEEGTLVTIKINPIQGKELQEEMLKVSYKDTYAKTTVIEEKKTYSFVMPRENVEITAAFSNCKYEIVYHVNGGETIPEDNCVYEFESGLVLPIPYRDGYRFDGWYDNEDLQGESVVCVEKTEFGDRELWAKWIEKSKITTVEITDFITPIAEKTLDTDVITSTIGISSADIVWKKEGIVVSGNAEWNTTYQATVQLLAGEDYEFTDATSVMLNGNLVGIENIIRNEDNALLVNCGEYTTKTRKMEKIEVPESPIQFSNYYTVDTILNETKTNAELNQPAKVTLEGTTTPNPLDMVVEWEVIDVHGNETIYDATPEVSNIFRWTIKESECADYDMSALKDSLTGTVTIKNKDYTPVTITGEDKKITYDGSKTFDISKYFSIDTNAGTANYTLLDTSTGAGSISGNILTITEAGTFDIKVRTVINGVYGIGEHTLTLTVEKATPMVSVVPSVADREYHPNVILSDSDLDSTNAVVLGVKEETITGTWRVKAVDGNNPVPEVENGGYVVVFTPDESYSVFYTSAKATVEVNVEKATPYIKTMPTVAGITYGQTLAIATLSGGTVTYGKSDSETDSVEVAGIFAWKKDDKTDPETVKPAVSDSESTAYTVVFTPTNKNYDTVETDITVTVNKAEGAPNKPGNTMEVDYANEKVSDITTLPKDWEWQDADKDKALTVGTPVKATAVYTGADKGNYVIESVEISITRQECTHATTELRNVVAATCTEKGYTGDTYCKHCGTLLETGTETEMIAHSYVNGVCSVCDDIFETTVDGIIYKVVTEIGADGKPEGKVVAVSGNDIPQVAVAVTGTGDDFTEKNPDGKVTVQSEITGSGSEQTFVVTKISDNAFSGASVTEIVVPATVEEAGIGAFGGATTITFNGSTVPVGIESAVSEAVTTVKVPEGAADSYREALGENANIVEVHTHVKDKGTRVEPTCEKKGSITYKCTKCGEVMEVVELAATGHKWDGGKVTKEATETAEGVKTYTCSVCGKTKTEAIPKKTATTPQPPKKGDVVADDKGTAKVEIADVTKKEVTYKEPANKKAKTVSIPATVTIDGVTYKVTKIADNAFKGNKTVTKVMIGSNIKTIGKNAFSGATKLKTVKIGKNVTEIGANAFKGCTSLTSVTLSGKTTKIGVNAFNGCKKLKTIKITSTKLTSKTVAKNAFKGLTKATTIKVPKKKLSAYKKLFKQKGLSSKVKVKEY